MTEIDVEGAIRTLSTLGKENYEYEAKESARGLSSDVWETVSAFANTEGGLILLGVSESDGFALVADFDIDKVFDQFVSGMGDGGEKARLTNLSKYFMQRSSLEGETLLAVRIFELSVSEKPCFIMARGVQGGSYKRLDDKDVKLAANEIYALQSTFFVDRSDRQPVGGRPSPTSIATFANRCFSRQGGSTLIPCVAPTQARFAWSALTSPRRTERRRRLACSSRASTLSSSSRSSPTAGRPAAIPRS